MSTDQRRQGAEGSRDARKRQSKFCIAEALNCNSEQGLGGAKRGDAAADHSVEWEWQANALQTRRRGKEQQRDGMAKQEGAKRGGGMEVNCGATHRDGHAKNCRGTAEKATRSKGIA